jgi:chitinase
VKRALVALALLGVLVPLRVGASSATFVAASANPGTTLSTAADFNTVAVALTDPGSPLRGTVALAATAASDRGLASVRFQSAPAGSSTWTDICTDTVAPFTCAFDTTTVADGSRDVRALALDKAGYTRTAVVAARRIDNTAPTTTLVDPGSPIGGTKTFTATATDTGSGVASVLLQYRAAGGTWTTLCAQTSCSFDTRTLADGLYDLRSLVTDTAGNTATSVVAARRVDNTAPAITLSTPAAVRGVATLTATTSDEGGLASVRYQLRTTPTGAWIDACTAAAAPYSCSIDTAAYADGAITLRAVATDRAGLTTTSATASSRIDNTLPTATLTAPPTLLAGTVSLNAGAADTGSGIASVRIERAPAGTTNWTTICTGPTCAWDTTTVPDGLYDLRAVATDVAGNTRASATVAGRRVDNAGPVVTLADPGSPLRRSVTLTATATDPAGVAWVSFQRRAAGATTWTELCKDTVAPYTCAWNTSDLDDGAYELRATAADTLGRSSISAIVAGRGVDNTGPRGAAIQAANGDGTAGRIDAGDVLTFTYSEAVAASSLLDGWDGGRTDVTVRLNDALVWDTLVVRKGTTTVALTGSLRLGGDYTWTGAEFDATLEQIGEKVVVTFGALVSGSTRNPVLTGSLNWTPSSVATDMAGNPASTASVTGTSGTDF